MLSPDLIKKADQIFLRSRRKVTNVFAGEFESAFRGSGIEFEEFREYIPGDDVRQIDWNVTARFDKPFIKIFREERERTLFLLIDQSHSQNFGAERAKREVVTEIAALLAYATLRTNDKIGLILFTDRVEKFIPPKKGRAHVWHLIATLLSHEPKNRGTNISEALRFLIAVATRRATCFLISDFWDEDFVSALKLTASKHDLIAVRVLDTLEKEISHGALIEFQDSESGKSLSTDLGNSTNRKNIALDLSLRTQQLQRILQVSRTDWLDLEANENYVDALLTFFLKREQKR